MAGMRLALRGPLGHGFHLPTGPRRVALAALNDSAGPLLPLVEVLPLDLLPEAPGWAHYLALDAPLRLLPGLPRLLGLERPGNLGCPAEVLARADMPCGGLAACGVCAVEARKGWKLACKDGPVFDWEELKFNG